jgi:hypothetical protein
MNQRTCRSASRFANLGRFAHHYWFVWVDEALLHHRFNLCRQFMTLLCAVASGQNANSKGEA